MEFGAKQRADFPDLVSVARGQQDSVHGPMLAGAGRAHNPGLPPGEGIGLAFDAARPEAYKSCTMQTPRSHRRFWLLAGLGLVLVGGGPGPARAGEAVIFSDSEKAGEKLEQSRKAPAQRKPRLENFLDRLSQPRGSSLEAVAPPPFAPTAPGAETVTPLTEKEWQQLKERQNWIHRRPEDLGKDARDPQRAFGVREQNQPGSPGNPKARQGWLVEYYQQLDKTRAEAENAVPGPLRNASGALRDRRRDSGRDGREPYGALAGEGTGRPEAGESLRPVGAAGFGRVEVAPGERSPAASEDLQFSAENPLAAPSGNEKGSRDPSWLRGAPGLERPRPGFATLPGMPTAPINPAVAEVNRLLGNDPLGNPLAANPVSSLDPVSTFPDPTREVLNPVTPAKPGEGRDSLLAPAARPSLETQPTRSRMLSGAPSLLGAEPPGTARSPLSQPPGAAAEERRALHSIKLNLELPRRSF